MTDATMIADRATYERAVEHFGRQNLYRLGGREKMKLIRVFPRRTKATPDDANVRTGPPGLFDEADAVHVSVAFSADIPDFCFKAEC